MVGAVGRSFAPAASSTAVGVAHSSSLREMLLRQRLRADSSIRHQASARRFASGGFEEMIRKNFMQHNERGSQKASVGKGVGMCLAVLMVFFVCFSLLVFRIPTANCAIQVFDVDNILPRNAQAAGIPQPFEIGTEENMPIDVDLNLDLTGVWWMDGNPLAYEQLVSFAGLKGKGPFPTTVHVPTSRKGHWTWSDTFVSRFINFYYTMTSEGAEHPLVFNFQNSSSAKIVPIAGVFDGEFGFEKISKDEWDRTDTYILRRILNADGNPTRFWDKFLTWYKGLYPSERIMVWRSDNDCLRTCQYFSPCFVCEAICVRGQTNSPKAEQPKTPQGEGGEKKGARSGGKQGKQCKQGKGKRKGKGK
jgi:hypothetical protein